jgi:hypothetical protein
LVVVVVVWWWGGTVTMAVGPRSNTSGAGATGYAIKSRDNRSDALLVLRCWSVKQDKPSKYPAGRAALTRWPASSSIQRKFAAVGSGDEVCPGQERRCMQETRTSNHACQHSAVRPQAEQLRRPPPNCVCEHYRSSSVCPSMSICVRICTL